LPFVRSVVRLFWGVLSTEAAAAVAVEDVLVRLTILGDTKRDGDDGTVVAEEAAVCVALAMGVVRCAALEDANLTTRLVVTVAFRVLVGSAVLTLDADIRVGDFLEVLSICSTPI